MDESFLYILGAGASCEAVPLVEEFPDQLISFANDLNEVRPTPNFPLSSRFTFTLFDHDDLNESEKIIAGSGLRQFVEALKWLGGEAKKHASIDTLAKKFFLKDDWASLKKLKAVLSSFLIVRQGTRGTDKRYDSFLASVLYRDDTEGLEIPSNIQFLTWNYDTQLEKAFYGFAEDNDEVYKNISHNDRVHRINGCCGMMPDGGWGDDFNSVWEAHDRIPIAMRHGIKLFNDYAQSDRPADIRFAWEDETNTRLPKILEAVDKTTVAVVIGYSFPYFNRDIDKRVFRNLPSLQKVYLQYPDEVHSTVRQRVQAIRPRLSADAIQCLTADNQFYIPDEYAPVRSRPARPIVR